MVRQAVLDGSFVEVDLCILFPLNDLVPHHNLIQGVGLGFVLRDHKNEELFDVPVEGRR